MGRMSITKPIEQNVSLISDGETRKSATIREYRKVSCTEIRVPGKPEVILDKGKKACRLRGDE